MQQMTIDEYRRLLGTTSLQSQYFQILQDQQAHCRKCAQQQIGSEQLAGGGGVQGLQRGNKSRPGIVILSENQQCPVCRKSTRWDRWTGEFKVSNSAAGISPTLQCRILNYYGNIDIIEQRQRADHELVVDHRFPMERWGEAESHNPDDMSTEEINRKFQLLKKDDSAYLAFHLKQGLKLLVVSSVLTVVTTVLCWTFIVPIVASIALVGVLVLQVMLFIDVCNNKAKEPYLIRNIKFLD